MEVNRKDHFERRNVALSTVFLPCWTSILIKPGKHYQWHFTLEKQTVRHQLNNCK